MNVNDFLVWWEGFSAAVNPHALTFQQWEALNKKIKSIKSGYVVNNIMPTLFPGIQIGDPVSFPNRDYQPSPMYGRVENVVQ